MKKKLTERQKQLWSLKQQGSSWDTIARELGMLPQSVGNMLTVIRKKLGLFVGKNAPRQGATMEVKNPMLAAAAIDAASDPVARSQAEAIEKVNKILKDAHVPGRVSEGLIRRMRVKYADVVTVKKQLAQSEEINMIGEQINLIGGYIDDSVCASANLRDLALAQSALIEKRQLLRGEPTQIISDAERRQLIELFPKVIAEGKRRGLLIEGEVIASS